MERKGREGEGERKGNGKDRKGEGKERARHGAPQPLTPAAAYDYHYINVSHLLTLDQRS